jgi:hypothetical protein
MFTLELKNCPLPQSDLLDDRIFTESDQPVEANCEI